MPNPVRLIAGAILGSAILCASANTAFAGDVANGKKIASQWCSQCHATGADASAPDAAPPFPAMATDPAYTDRRLETWLAEPHPPMPNFELSRRTIDDVIAYIRSLSD